jgi:hypothetical protein
MFPSRPRTKEELYNRRHASARNAVERIIGILKRRFRILHQPPSYDMNVQTLIPPATCAIHNFIRRYDPDELESITEGLEDWQPGLHMEDGDLAMHHPNRREVKQANKKRDSIAQQMWDDYVAKGGLNVNA